MVPFLQTTWSSIPLLEHLHPRLSTFLAIPQTLNRQGNIVVGYLGASYSTPYEIYEEALYLALLLKYEVSGIQPQLTLCHSSLDTNNAIASKLVSTWQTFLNDNYSGHFIQYFYGDSILAVEKALAQFTPSKSYTFTFIGVNPTKCPSFPCQIIKDSSYLCSLHSSYTEISLPTSPNAKSIFFKRFNDLTFSSVLIKAFLESAGIDNPGPTEQSTAKSEVTYTLEFAPPLL